MNKGISFIALFLLCGLLNVCTCTNSIDIHFTDNNIDISEWTFTFQDTNLFAAKQGNVRYYRLSSSNVYELDSTISDSQNIIRESSIAVDGNVLIVGKPSNDTVWTAAVYFKYNDGTWQSPYIIHSNGEECTNVGKSVLLFDQATELIIGGDTCILFYDYNATGGSWFKSRVIDGADGNGLRIGNNDNLITSTGPFPGLPEFGLYLINNLYCRNNREASWGVCLEKMSAYGQTPTVQYLCDDQRVLWLSVMSWGTYQLSGLVYNVSDQTNVLFQTNDNIFDYNLGVSSDCNTIAYNYLDPLDQSVSIHLLTYNNGTYVFDQSFANARLTSPNMQYLIDGVLVNNIVGITDTVAYVNIFSSGNMRRNENSPELVQKITARNP